MTSPLMTMLAGTAIAFATAAQAAVPQTDLSGGPHATREHVPLFYDNMVLNWNEAILAAVRANKPRPTVTARNLHIMHNAIYDAWAAYDAVALGTRFGDALRQPADRRNEANAVMALSYAAHRAASVLYPDNQNFFDSMMEAQGFPIDWENRDPTTPAGVGNLAAEAVLAYWAEDGSNWQNNFADTTGYSAVNDPAIAPWDVAYDPNRWQPLTVPTGAVRDDYGNPTITDDPSSFTVQGALSPHWGQVQTFALPSGDAVRPPAPPQYGDDSPYTDALGRTSTNHQAWLDQYGEVLVLTGSLDDPETGAPRRCIAEFWADGPRSDTPPGHWNQIAQGIALRDDFTVGQAVQLYFALTGALHDAAIAAWDAKYAYDSNRPVTAIRFAWADQTIMSWVGPNRGVHAMPGTDFLPYQEVTFMTPPFPEYVSGHSTFSMSAATVIVGYAGTDTFYDPENPTFIQLDLDDEPGPDVLGRFVDSALTFEEYDGPPMVLQWRSLYDAAYQAGDSRLYGGIHIQDANLYGREMGEQIGAMALDRVSRLIEGTAEIEDPATLADPPRPPAPL